VILAAFDFVPSAFVRFPEIQREKKKPGPHLQLSGGDQHLQRFRLESFRHFQLHGRG